jgi:hypothetical protein
MNLRIRCKFEKLSPKSRAFIWGYEAKHNVYYVEVTNTSHKKQRPFIRLPEAFTIELVLGFFEDFLEDFCLITDQILEDWSLTDVGQNLLENLRKEIEKYSPN